MPQTGSFSTAIRCLRWAGSLPSRLAQPARAYDRPHGHRPPRPAHGAARRAPAGAPGAARQPDPGARPDDVWIAGRRCQPGVRTAARPRVARPQPPAPRLDRGRARAPRRRDLRRVLVVSCTDRARTPRGPAVGRPVHRLPADDPSMTDVAAPELVGIEDIRAAAEVLRGIAVRTPLVPFGRPDRGQWLKA